MRCFVDWLWVLGFQIGRLRARSRFGDAERRQERGEGGGHERPQDAGDRLGLQGKNLHGDAFIRGDRNTKTQGRPPPRRLPFTKLVFEVGGGAMQNRAGSGAYVC